MLSQISTPSAESAMSIRIRSQNTSRTDNHRRPRNPGSGATVSFATPSDNRVWLPWIPESARLPGTRVHSDTPDQKPAVLTGKIFVMQVQQQLVQEQLPCSTLFIIHHLVGDLRVRQARVTASSRGILFLGEYTAIFGAFSNFTTSWLTSGSDIAAGDGRCLRVGNHLKLTPRMLLLLDSRDLPYQKAAAR